MVFLATCTAGKWPPIAHLSLCVCCRSLWSSVSLSLQPPHSQLGVSSWEEAEVERSRHVDLPEETEKGVSGVRGQRAAGHSPGQLHNAGQIGRVSAYLSTTRPVAPFLGVYL